MMCITDVNVVAAVVLSCRSDVVAACCMRCPCFADAGDNMGFDFASHRHERVGVVIMLAPKVGVR